MFQHATTPTTSSYSVSDAHNLIGVDTHPFISNSIEPVDEEELLVQIESTICTETIDIFSSFSKIEFQNDGEDSEEENTTNTIEVKELSVDQKMKNCSISYLSGFICNRIKKFKCL